MFYKAHKSAKISSANTRVYAFRFGVDKIPLWFRSFIKTRNLRPGEMFVFKTLQFYDDYNDADIYDMPIAGGGSVRGLRGWFVVMNWCGMVFMMNPKSFEYVYARRSRRYSGFFFHMPPRAGVDFLRWE